MKSIFKLIIILAIIAINFTVCDTDGSSDRQKTPDKTYTVTFNRNGAYRGSIPSITVDIGFSITIPEGTSLENIHYTFGGWNTEASGSGYNYQAGSTFTPTANTTLYAKWNPGYYITFNANGGSGTVPPTQTAEYNSSIVLPSGSSLYRDSYTFAGWYFMASPTYIPGTLFTVSGATNFLARWEICIWCEWSVTTAPTCTTAGVETRECLFHESQTRSINALGHNWSNWVETLAPTQTTNGEEARKCNRDNSHMETRIVHYTNLPDDWFELIVPENISYRIKRGNSEPPDEVYIPASYRGLPVTHVENNSSLWVFGYANIKSIYIPASVTYIDRWSFTGSNITNINIDINNPNYSSDEYFIYNKLKTEIISCLFAKSSVIIPASVISGINDQTFHANLTNISVDNNNPNYTSDGGILYNKTKTRLIKCPQRKSGEVLIPLGVTNIGVGSFYACVDLTSITIPTSVVTIEQGAFQNIYTGSLILIIPPSVMYIGPHTFNYWKNTQTIIIQGKSNIVEAVNAWGADWLLGNEAKIVYEP